MVLRKLIAGNAGCITGTGSMEGWSVCEKVPADDAGGGFDCTSHFGHLPFGVLKS